MGQAAEPRVDGREQALDLGLKAHIGLNRDRPPAGLLDVGHHRVGGRFVAQIVHHHVIACRSGEPGGRGPDAAARAGDEDDLGGGSHFKSCFDARAGAAPSRC
jgi:hypothetical protein